MFSRHMSPIFSVCFQSYSSDFFTMGQTRAQNGFSSPSSVLLIHHEYGSGVTVVYISRVIVPLCKGFSACCITHVFVYILAYGLIGIQVAISLTTNPIVHTN